MMIADCRLCGPKIETRNSKFETRLAWAESASCASFEFRVSSFDSVNRQSKIVNHAVSRDLRSSSLLRLEVQLLQFQFAGRVPQYLRPLLRRGGARDRPIASQLWGLWAGRRGSHTPGGHGLFRGRNDAAARCGETQEHRPFPSPVLWSPKRGRIHD